MLNHRALMYKKIHDQESNLALPVSLFQVYYNVTSYNDNGTTFLQRPNTMQSYIDYRSETRTDPHYDLNHTKPTP